MTRVIVPGRYETSLDRAGLALAAGASLGGAVACVIVLFGKSSSWFALPAVFSVGAVVTLIPAVALGGPLWVAAHALGKRGPVSAAIVGAVAGFFLFLAGQTHAFGLAATAPTEPRALLYRWISAAVISLLFAAIAAGIALVMWRVAYRRG